MQANDEPLRSQGFFNGKKKPLVLRLEKEIIFAVYILRTALILYRVYSISYMVVKNKFDYVNLFIFQ